MNPSVFRQYDIRGVADRDLPDDFVHDLGRAVATMISEARTDHPESSPWARPTIAVGHDSRLTGPRLHQALISGVVCSGVDVIDIGMVPTPLLYFAAFHWQLDGAVIVTGSHNPPPDNGFKILRGTTSIHGATIRALHTAISNGALIEAPSEDRGEVEERDIVPAYLDHAASCLRLGERRPKVVVDAGNGVGGPTTVALYEQLGFEVVPLYCEPDGRFPNHHPDPTVAANLADLCQTVADTGADLGIALDGDSDRIGAVDHRGNILWGDQLMIILGRAVLAEEPGATFIAEVKCSQSLYDELSKAGGNPIMSRVGHSLMKARMKQTDAALGGEMSGHIFFAHRYLGFDDAIYAGARLLEILSNDERSLADLYDTLPRMVNTPEIRIDCADEIKFDIVTRVTQSLRDRADVVDVIDIDGARARFADGWGLVRASNTQPALVMRCEAVDQARLTAIRTIIEDEIAAASETP